MFPRIEHIDDVTPHISFDRGFVVSQRTNHTVIDYVYTVPETFRTAMACECRGLKFDADGRLIARPFHKFFNLGERERIEDIDWSAAHDLLDKLDGSMVHPVMLEGNLIFMTRMGVTGQARLAQRHADECVLDLSRHLLASGNTPIFEFTSPQNRIVVAYDKPVLTLLAVRAMTSGNYLTRAETARLSERFGVPIVRTFGRVDDPKSFVAKARQESGIEGYVVTFDDGRRIKLKTDGYVLRHRALAGVQFEKNVLGWVANGAVDDVVALLPEDVATRVLDYQAFVNSRVTAHAVEIVDFAAEHRGSLRKDYAALAFKRFDKRLTRAVFAAYEGKDPRANLVDMLVHAAGSELRVEAARDLIGMRWSVEGLALPELEP